MEHRRHIVPSSYPSHQLLLDGPSGHLRARQPLSDSAGNSQHHTLASSNIYHDSKEHHPRVERHMYTPTVPSQHSRPSLGNSLELRRQSSRRRRQQRPHRNPIADSIQYQNYRQRQQRDGNSDDAKWPEILEAAFLDALVEIPAMGRRKFSFKGKPHGRNELIMEYLWIAYCQSLPPGQIPDKTMQRTRKQVSSHIQVLKGFFRDHPEYNRLFPPKNVAKNGFEDSFKNDPTLRAISQGQLPTKRYQRYEEASQANSMRVVNQPQQIQPQMRPVLFWLLIATPEHPADIEGDYTEEDLCRQGIVPHKFTGLSAQRQIGSLESIPQWRQKFPYLERLQLAGEFDCDIIHMDVSLNLMSAHPPEGSQLCSRTELAIPSKQFEDSEWRVITTLSKPPELYREDDPPLNAKEFYVDVLSANDAETRIKLTFPAGSWANAFTCLVNAQTKNEERRRASQYGMPASSSMKSPRDLVEELSMYQEIRSSAGVNRPFTRRAIIIWTFHKARVNEGSGTNWRYIDTQIPRQVCMSPTPHTSHHVSASMNENFAAWVDAPLHLNHTNLVDPFVQGLATPPHTAGLQSSFAGQGYYNSGIPSFDLPSDNLSFMTSKTADSESTLVDNDPSTNIDNFLSNTDIHLNYDHHSTNWHLPTSESFDADPAWASYTVPSSIPQLWPEVPGTKPITWIDDATDKQDWATQPNNSQQKNQIYIAQSIEQKLPPWIEHHGSEIKTIQEEVEDEVVSKIPAVSLETGGSKGDWENGHDGYDFTTLTERIK